MFERGLDRVGPAASLGALVPVDRGPRMSSRPEGPATAETPAPIGAPRNGFDNWASQARAAFIAQLAATALDLPQTRRRRRATPEDAAGAYAAALDRRVPRAPGTRFGCFA